MFWKFDLHPTLIDSILTKEDCTLNEILDEDDVLQETKSQNRKLIDFFVRPDILEELVNLIIHEPGDDVDEKLKYNCYVTITEPIYEREKTAGLTPRIPLLEYKHPNTACEVLTSDVYTIIDKLTSDEDLLNKIWSFLNAEPPVNPLLASFFSKLMGVLLSRKTSLMIEFLKSKENFVELLVKHFGTSAIMDLLLRLITSVESPQTRTDLLEWLTSQKLIEGLVSLIDPEVDEDRNSNAAQALCDIIRLSRDNMSQLQENAESDPLLDTIQRRETISDLLSHMIHNIHSHRDPALVNGISVLLTLLEVKRGSMEGEEPLTALDAERLAQGVSATLAALTPRLKDFHGLLQDPPQMRPMITTAGTLDPPLGNARLQVSKLIAAILATNSDTINAELANLGTVQVLLDLFFKYSWNNFLHTQVERCITTILNNPPTEEDGEQSIPLLNVLFRECKIVQRILQTWEDNDQEVSQSGTRRGYMGHLTSIANAVALNHDKGRNKKMIENLFNDLPEGERERWNSFVSSSLADTNKTNQSELVGHPLQSSSDDEEEFRPVSFLSNETSLQQAYSQYQMQRMTNDFMDTFGLDEEEFHEPESGITAPFDRIGDINFQINTAEDNPNAALFEACCNEKINQFDDSGSDEEDIWEEKELTFSSLAESRQSTLSGDGASDSESSGSDEDEVESPCRGSVSSSGSDEDRIVFSDETQNSPGAAAKQPVTKDGDHKMEVDSSEVWAVSFDSTEVSMDEAITVDASAVGWENAPASVDVSPVDSGWATFDNFTSITMAAKAESEKRPESPVAMETEQSTAPVEPAGAAYVVKEDKSLVQAEQDTSVDQGKGLVTSADQLGVSKEPEERRSDESPVVNDRAAAYKCQETKEDDQTAPLATNDSDDDISDDEGEDAVSSKREEKPSRLAPVVFTSVVPETPNVTTADRVSTPSSNSREEPAADSTGEKSELGEDDVTSTHHGNGPTGSGPDDTCRQQSLSKKSKLGDTRPPLPDTVEPPSAVANGPG